MSATTLKVMNSPQNSIDTIKEMTIPIIPGKSGIITKLPRKIFMNDSTIKRIEINRNETLRLRRLHFLRDHIPTHDEVSIFIVENPLKVELDDGETVLVEPGVKLANGNSRRLYYKTYPEYEPDTSLIANVYYIDTAKEYKDLYYSYDSQDSVEVTADKIQGVLGLLNVNVTSTTAKGGKFATALTIAYGEKAPATTLVSAFKSEIELLDKLGLFQASDKTMRFQTLYAAGLIAAKYWNTPTTSRERMISGLQALATFRSDDANWKGDDWDGITAIQHQVSDGSKNWIPEAMMRKTNYSAIEPQMNFFLYCFEKYMMGQKLNKTKGYKAANWEGKYVEILSQF